MSELPAIIYPSLIGGIGTFDRNEAPMLLGYARTSTALQEISITAQEAELRRLGCEQVFIDQGFSGGKFANRPAFTKMVSEVARAGDTIVVTKLDRLARNTRGVLDLVEELSARGIALKSGDGIDTSSDSPVGKMMLTLMAAFAEMERSLIRMRTKEALAAKFPTGRPRGLQGGRPAAIKDAKQHAAIRTMYDSGQTAKSISESIRVSESTVWRSLQKTTSPVKV
ncbi:recombinase family protein [Lacisediminihabitans sp. FW035]